MALHFDCADPAERHGAIATAAHTISTGDLVVLPTDTVYGIGADAFDGRHVETDYNAPMARRVSEILTA